MSEAVLSARDLGKQFRTGSRFSRRRLWVQAVADVSFELVPGRTLAIVGESGCGKSTLARLITGLAVPDHGVLKIAGIAAASLSHRERCRRVQLVFQDPKRALNPTRRVRDLLDTPLRTLCGLPARERLLRSRTVLAEVGLDDTVLDRYPSELSGGQAQRVGIARALVVKPEVLVLDEALSSLDVSLQAEVLRLLHRHQRESGIAYVFISHDLAVVEALADTIAVMYLGRFVESGPSRSVMNDPRHPYTRALLSAVPVPGGENKRIPQRGEPGDAAALPTGCHYHPRCYRAESECETAAPRLKPVPAVETGETRQPGALAGALAGPMLGVMERQHCAACLFADDTDPATWLQNNRGRRRRADGPTDGQVDGPAD